MALESLIWKSIKDVISQQTGLQKDEDIEAYAHFCHFAGLEDGVLMTGDIEHLFYEDLYETADEEEKAYENQINEDRGNHRIAPGFLTEMQKKAKKIMEGYMTLFQVKHLVTEPKLVGLSTTKYPVLVGYNYFNDEQFYRKTERNGRTLIR